MIHLNLQVVMFCWIGFFQTTLKSEKAKVEERLNKQPSPIKKWANKNK